MQDRGSDLEKREAALSCAQGHQGNMAARLDLSFSHCCNDQRTGNGPVPEQTARNS